MNDGDISNTITPELRPKMPVFFLGHGNPLNAILDNAFTQSLATMGRSITVKPTAILVISAHWLTRGTYVNTTLFPETIYDFYGFPEVLYRVKYPAPGAPESAQQVIQHIADIKEDPSRGLDHGAWTVLKHLFPQADIPVFQLSIDYERPFSYHVELAKKLASLREQGILIIGSGNIVHNIPLSIGKDDVTPLDWAIRFDAWAKAHIVARDLDGLIHYERAGKDALLAVPTIDHYVPLLYCLALADDNEKIRFPFEEVWAGMSMRCLEITTQ